MSIIRGSSSGDSARAMSSAAEAPIARASTQLHRVDVEVLFQDGTPTAARIATRSSFEPPKWTGSVSTEIAAAPPRRIRLGLFGRRDAGVDPALGRRASLHFGDDLHAARPKRARESGRRRSVRGRSRDLRLVDDERPGALARLGDDAAEGSSWRDPGRRRLHFGPSSDIASSGLIRGYRPAAIHLKANTGLGLCRSQSASGKY